MDSLETRIISVIARFSNKSEEEIRPEHTFEELDLTSLDSVMIAFDLEDELGVKLPDTSDIYAITTVQELIEEISKHLETEGID